MPVTYQPRPIPSIWIMESSRHSVHCLSLTTTRLLNPERIYSRSKNNERLLYRKTSTFPAPWHNLPPILWHLRKHPNYQTRWSTWIASLAASGKPSFELMPSGNGDSGLASSSAKKSLS